MFKGNKSKKDLDFFTTIKGLMEEDRKLQQAGIKGETRLIPHEKIKLEIMVKAYEVDLLDEIKELKSIEGLPSLDVEEKIKKMKRDVEELIYNLRREPHSFISQHFENMKSARTDFSELEGIVRKENSIFSIVPPLEL